MTTLKKLFPDPIITDGTQRDLARQIAFKAHEGQFRHDRITPYIEHVFSVARNLSSEDDETQAVAWLHDTLEDSELTIKDLAFLGVIESVRASVWLLTKHSGKSYIDYLRGVKASRMATKVKIADMLHNLSDSPSRNQIIKYADGLLYLHGAA